jgi:hypothetical protein
MSVATVNQLSFPTETQKVSLSEYKNHFHIVEKYSENMTFEEHTKAIEEWLEKQ